jgi:hypothetical protein
MRCFRFTVVLLFLFGCVLLPPVAKAQLPPAPPTTLPAQAPSTDDLEDSAATRHLKSNIADLFKRGDYAEIDRIADGIRQDKTRLVGGGWLITRVYQALEATKDTTPEEHIAQLNAWIAARPQSITPRVALARAYIRDAWAVRGSDDADSGKVFAERIELAKKTLEDSANLTPMCPDWFFQMQTVAMAQGWDKRRAGTLFEQAIRFEPDYLYYYQGYARYLLPKWDGKNGDDVAFSKQIADAVGGSKGDFIYYQIGIVVLGICNCTVQENPLDWARLERGYRVQGEMFKNTNYDTNQLALLAWRFHDRAVAKQAFAAIGDRWSKNVWKNRSHFNKARAWADA